MNKKKADSPLLRSYRPITKKNKHSLRTEQKTRNPKYQTGNITNNFVNDQDEVDNNLWTSKYYPRRQEDLIGNYSNIQSIKTWIASFDTNKKKVLKLIQEANALAKAKAEKRGKNGKIGKPTRRKRINNLQQTSCLLVTGDNGVGKTVGVNIVLKQLGYEVKCINFGEMKNNKDVKSTLGTLKKIKNVVDMRMGQPKKYAIIIDKIENISAKTGKSNILAFQKDNDLNWHFPIIFVSSNKHSKLLNDLGKVCTTVMFNYPSSFELEQLTDKIIKTEHLNISSEAKDLIIQHAQFDIGRLITILQDLNTVFAGEKITSKKFEVYVSNSGKKNISVGINRATEGLLYQYLGINKCSEYFKENKTLMALMAQQHYYSAVFARNLPLEQSLETLREVSQCISFGDIIENSIYGSQSWELQEIHGFNTCTMTSYYVDKYTKDNHPELGSIPIEFAQDLNRTSIKNINKKNINNIEKCFKNKSIYDYIMINKILRELISNNQLEECVKLLVGYDISIDNIKSLLKIDKIKNAKNNLTSKQKNELLELLAKYHIGEKSDDPETIVTIKYLKKGKKKK